MDRGRGDGPVARTQRREFLASLAGLAAIPALRATSAGRALLSLAGRDTEEAHEVLPGYWTSLPGVRTSCHVCPLDCVLEDGETCFCRTRTNRGGRLYTTAYGNPCLLAADPIEKVPLNHFLPGEKTLALGTGGCNLRCLYCQNWEQSQEKPLDLKNHDLPVERAADSLAGSDIRTIAFTYTEPIAFLEYLCDVAAHARAKKIRCVAATALFATPPAAKHLGRHLDAACVAIKAFDETFYDKVCGIKLAPVLEATEALAAEKVWIEITTLVVPGYNDDEKKLGELARWIATTLGADTPWHLARFVPQYRLASVPRTPIETLERLREVGRDAGLAHVYLSNVAPHEGNHTDCARCGARAIERLGFELLANRLAGKGACPKCHRRLAGVWA
ncbi:MAG: AmmeMemoRadiSam system radical SAM enzyme [Planctomycetota bacterium]